MRSDGRVVALRPGAIGGHPVSSGGNGGGRLGTVRWSASTLLSRVVDPLVVVAAFATIPLTLAEWPRESIATPLFIALDWTIWAVFLLELILLLAVRGEHPSARATIWLSAAVVVVSCPLVPVLLGSIHLAELAQLARLARLGRLAGAVALGLPLMRRVLRPGVIYVVGITALVIFSCAGIFALTEPRLQGDYWAAVWLAIVTAATVGYGDLSPQTLTGRVVAVILMVAGVGLMTTLAASIAAAFVDQEEDKTLHRVMKRLDRLEAMLEELREHRRT
jgi:voltage-gated potassium channel